MQTHVDARKHTHTYTHTFALFEGSIRLVTLCWDSAASVENPELWECTNWDGLQNQEKSRADMAGACKNKTNVQKRVSALFHAERHVVE